MPSTSNPIRGILLTDKPAGVSRCGMSQATFAQHCFTNKWYELSANGQIIGSALDLDFYKHGNQQGPSKRSTVITKELSKV